ncbi:MAG: alpha/beta hydrolase, partial [Candidatus Rokuibacteriota bacterium]
TGREPARDTGREPARDTGREPARDTGAGTPTILLLHGWMFPSDLNWFTSYGPLSELGRVLAIDHRGHGHGLRAHQPFRLTDAADDAAAVLRTLGTGPVIAVGYSMGGPVAQLLWQRHPDLVAGVVLCATSATFSVTARDRWLWRGMGALQLVLRLLPRHWWEALIQRQVSGRLPIRISRMVNAQTPPEVLELLPWFLSEVARGSAEDLAEAGRELGRYDAREWIGALDVPSAVVITTRDDLVPVANQRDLVSRIPACAVFEVVLDHDAPVAAPDVFVPVLSNAIQEVLREVLRR